MSSDNKERARRDLDLWRAWKADPKEETLIPLMESIRPLVNQRVGEFSRAPVPQAAVRATATSLALKALHSYNPSSGTQLGSWVYKQLRGVHSEVSRHQNIGRIPYRRSRQIGTFKDVVAELTEELGYEPDAATIAAKMNESLAEVGRLRASSKWTPKHVKKLQVELGRGDLIESKALDVDRLDDLRAGTEREVLRYIYHDLDPREKSVFEYQYGLYGRPQLNVTQTAAALKLSAPTITRIRQSIQKQVDERMRRRGM